MRKKVLRFGCTDFPFVKKVIENEMLVRCELEKAAADLYGFDFGMEPDTELIITTMPI